MHAGHGICASSSPLTVPGPAFDDDGGGDILLPGVEITEDGRDLDNEDTLLLVAALEDVDIGTGPLPKVVVDGDDAGRALVLGTPQS